MDRLFANPNVVENATPPRRNILKFWAKEQAPKVKVEPPKDVEFKKHEFTLETGAKNTEKVKFNPVLQADYQMFMENKMQSLINLYNENTASPIFNSERYAYIPKLLQDLADKDSATGEYKFNPDKIKQRLQSDPGLWKTATQMMEEDIAMSTWALALEAQMNPNNLRMFLLGGRNTNADRLSKGGSLHLNINRGVLNKWVNTHTGRVAGVLLAGAGGVAGHAAGQALNGPAAWTAMANAVNLLPEVARAGAVQALNSLGMGGIGAIAGAGATGLAAGAAVGAYAGMRSLMKHGVTVDMERNSDYLSVLKDPRFEAERAYLNDVLNINVDDYKVNGMGRVVSSGNYQRSAHVAKLEEDLMGKMMARMNMYTNGLKIPPDRVRAVPENYAFRKAALFNHRTTYSNEQDYEPVMTTWKKEEIERFDKLFAKKKAESGGSKPFSTADFLELMYEARSDVISRRLDRRLREARIKKGGDEQTIKMLDKKIQNRTNDGELVKKKTAEYQGVKDALTAVKPLLEGDQTKLDTYENAVLALEKVREEARNNFGTDSVAELNRMLKERSNLNELQINDLITELKTAEDSLDALRHTIENYDSQFEAARKDLTNIVDPVGGYDQQLILNGVPPVGLTNADFATQPLAELLDRINVAYLAGRTFTPPINIGWPQAFNTDIGFRSHLLRMISEARAESRGSVLMTAPIAELTTWRTAGISEHAMRSSTVEDLFKTIEDAGLINVGTLPTMSLTNPADRATFQKVIDQARLRFNLRTNAFGDVVALEEKWREEYNAGIAASKQVFTDTAAEYRNYSKQLALAQAEEKRIRDNHVEIGKNYINENTNEYFKTIKVLEDWHNQLSAVPGYTNDLDPTALTGISLPNLLSRINSAHTFGAANGVTVGWAAADNGLSENVRKLISSYTEIQVQQDFKDNEPMEQLKLLHVSLQEIREKPPEEIIKKINGHPTYAGWIDDQATRDHVQKAKDLELVSRMDKRKTRLAQSITLAKAMGGIYTNADIAYLTTNAAYNKAASDLLAVTTEITGRGWAVNAVTLEMNARSNELSARNLREINPIGELQIEQTALTNYATKYNELLDKRKKVQDQTGSASIESLNKLANDRKKYTVEQLTDIEKRVADAQRNVQEQTPAAQQAKEVVTVMESSFKELAHPMEGIYAKVNAVATPPAGTELDASRLRSLPYDEILRRVNALHEFGKAQTPPIEAGWPKDHNNRPEIRKKVMEAVAEAKADVSYYISTLSPLDLQTDINNWRRDIGDFKLMSMTPDQLVASVTPPPALARAEEVIKQVHIIYNKRRDEHGKVIQTIDPLVVEADKKIANAKATVEAEGKAIKVVRDIVSHPGDSAQRTHEFVKIVAKKDLTATVDPADTTYSSQEKTPTPAGSTALPPPEIGYIEIVNLFKGHKKSTETERGAAFQEMLNVRMFQPDEIARRLNDAADLELTTVDMPSALAELQNRIRAGYITTTHMQEIVDKMQQGFVATANAM